MLICSNLWTLLFVGPFMLGEVECGSRLSWELSFGAKPWHRHRHRMPQPQAPSLLASVLSWKKEPALGKVEWRAHFQDGWHTELNGWHPTWTMNAFCTKPNCLALHHKLLTYAGGEFYYADLGANIPTTEDIDFYYSPILASLRDFLSLFGAASVFCLSYTVRDMDFSPFLTTSEKLKLLTGSS